MELKSQIKKMKWPMLALLAIAAGSSEAYCTQHTLMHTQNKQDTIIMKKILVIGIDPNTIDFSNPDLVPGLTAEKVLAGLKAEKEKLYALNFDTDFFLMGLQETDISALAAYLKTHRYDGIVIGAGVRVPQNTFILFEKIINAVHAHAPESKIMFNTLPTNTSEAVLRWLE